MDSNFLAKRLQSLGTETAFEILAKAKALEKEGRSIIHFEIGEPDFETPKHIIEKGVTSLRTGATHYTPANGLLTFRETIANHINKTRNVTCSPNDVVVTPGAKPIMFFSLLSCINEGDEVIYPNPGFPIYESMINFVGGKAIPLPLHESRKFRFDSQELRDLITPKTKMIIINSPHNPTGGILTMKELKLVAELAKKNDLLVLADEIYDGILYDANHESILSLPGMKERTILLAGHSKNYAMTGWRLGYGIFPPSIAPMITKLIVNSVSSTAEFTQLAGIAALEGTQEPVREMVREWKYRRDLMVDQLNGMNLSCQTPEGAFYVFPNVSSTRMESRKLAEYLLHQGGVAVLDGGCFGKYGNGHIRLSYATSRENIIEGLRRIGESLQRLQKEHSPSLSLPESSQTSSQDIGKWKIYNPTGNKRVVVTRNMPGQKWIDLLTSSGFQVEVGMESRVLSTEEIKRAIGNHCDGIIGQLTERWDRELFETFAKAGGKVFSNMAVGYDNVDVKAATDLGIFVGNTPGVLTETTAEMAVALTFAAARHIPQADRFMRNGKYEGWDPSLFLGKRLHQGTLGIIGAGRIGSAYAKMMAMGHQMNVLYFDPQRNIAMEEQLNSFSKLIETQGGKPITCRRVSSVDEMLPLVDVLSLHTVLSPETFHLINATRLKMMKHSALLINTSRGPIIDERALVTHCRSHNSFCVALDVFENEPAMVPGLDQLDNVIVVPHIASATKWTREGMATLAASNVRGMLTGASAWNSSDISPFVDNEIDNIPRAAPSIVNAQGLGLNGPRSAE